jgi:hypothetical protein
MKRIKIMLMSLTVLAIVGGALAFKSHKVFDSFCYGVKVPTVSPPAQSACPNFTDASTSEGTELFYAKPAASIADCVGNCPQLALTSQE